MVITIIVLGIRIRSWMVVVKCILGIEMAQQLLLKIIINIIYFYFYF